MGAGGLQWIFPEGWGGLPLTPLPKNENRALVHGFRADLLQGDSDGATIPGSYSNVIRGGSDRAGGGEGSPGNPPSHAGGG